MGALGETYWKGLWTIEGIYILVNVTDNVLSIPNEGTDPATSWMYDKPELYFDANYIQKDGMGPASGQGHYCFAPPPVKDQSGSLPLQFNQNGSAYCYKVSGSSYLVEYFIPFADILDKDFLPLDKSVPMGFDITIVDNDVKTPMRNRMSWANAGKVDENWNNMDDAGQITLDAGPCVHFYPIEKITLIPGSITTNKGTLQMVPILEPELASIERIQWSVINRTGQATISETGLVTALSDGTVTIKAVSKDEPFVEATTALTISGQFSNDSDPWNYYNLIKNWDFTTDLTNWGGWVDSGVDGQTPPEIVNGVVVMTAGQATDGAYWHYQLNQSGFKAAPNVPYILKFKSWSSIPKLNMVDFEDTPQNNYNRYGASTDPEANLGRSEWTYATTTEPQWFTFHVVFDQMVPTTQQKIQWMLSNANATTYLDSVLLVRGNDSSIVAIDYLELSAHSIALEETEETASVMITSNTNWEVQSDQSWLRVNPSTGSGNQTITLSAMANPMHVNRTAVVTVYALNIDPQTITVVQKANPGDPVEPNDSIVEHWSPEAWSNYNLIKNWDFNTNLFPDWGGWVDGAVSGQMNPVIENGVVKMTAGMASDGNYWHYQFNQWHLQAEFNVPYTLRFKSWSSITKWNMVDFEDTSENAYNRYGASTDAEASLGRSEWVYATTTEPQWFTFHVVFDQQTPETIQKIQWMFSNANATTYLDSVILIKDEDLLRIKEAELALSTSYIDMKNTEDHARVDVSSNTNSLAISDQDWITVSPQVVTGNKTLTIATKANPENTSRTATITLYPAGLKSRTITVVQASTTDIKTIAENREWTLYPNPTQGRVKLVFGKIPPQETYITVIDLTGKTILKQLVQNKEEWIDLKGNPPGLYLIKTNLKDAQAHKLQLK